ncbi:hypothetical protein RT99_03060 [Flavobacterium sp. MEB061]|uniref:hypothetical protein n=1 Tax=Flavobacterium sp. MEB061 TaxID=1587524 RepID=UPI0005AC5EB4|nr:hypothetical protein [Flavobacterium sp. MEB061]KIQ24076.1 hypothetical protein RT99_03060 [Flavobacterium sp. MEB061]
MNYHTYWSISDLPTNSIKSFEVFLWISIISLIIWIITKKYKKNNGDYEKSILLWLLGIVFSFSIVMFFYLKFWTIDYSEERIQKLLHSSYVSKVEGKISDFKSFEPVSRRGNVTVESFKVDSIEFQYEDALLGRFNRFTKTNNGVFKDGLNVRITFEKTNHNILKVEIAK